MLLKKKRVQLFRFKHCRIVCLLRPDQLETKTSGGRNLISTVVIIARVIFAFSRVRAYYL